METTLKLYSLAGSEVLVTVPAGHEAAIEARLNASLIEVEAVETGKRWRVRGSRLRVEETIIETGAPSFGLPI